MSTDRAAQIATVAVLPTRLETLVVGLSPEELTTHYLAGEWTVAQNVHHLVDSHVSYPAVNGWACARSSTRKRRSTLADMPGLSLRNPAAVRLADSDGESIYNLPRVSAYAAHGGACHQAFKQMGQGLCLLIAGGRT